MTTTTRIHTPLDILAHVEPSVLALLGEATAEAWDGDAHRAGVQRVWRAMDGHPLPDTDDMWDAVSRLLAAEGVDYGR